MIIIIMKTKKNNNRKLVTKESIKKFIQEEILDEMSEEYNGENCLEYDFLPHDIMIGFENIKNRLVMLKDTNSNLTNEEKNIFQKYNNWVKDTFFKDVAKENLFKSYTHIRKIQTESTYFSESPVHREFNNEIPYMYNVLCYYSNDNCNLNNCGLGLIYKNKENKYKKIILPVINGLTLKIRDKCFFHFTPKLIPLNSNKTVTRILIRSYYSIDKYKSENNTFNSKSESLGKIFNNNRKMRQNEKIQKTIKKNKLNSHKKKINNTLENTILLRNS